MLKQEKLAINILGIGHLKLLLWVSGKMFNFISMMKSKLTMYGLGTD